MQMKDLFLRIFRRTFFDKLVAEVSKPFRKEYDLVIIDDAFPSLLSAFRVHEFNAYLDSVKRSIVYCSEQSIKFLEGEHDFGKVKRTFKKVYPRQSRRIIKYQNQPLKAKLAYFVFLNNVYKYLNEISKYEIPFVFTLYPGGGFMLEDPVADEKLKTVFSSPYFRHVIVTSPVTIDYLLKKNICPRHKIKYIYGVVTPPVDAKSLHLKNLTKSEKNHLDICFVAFKYTSRGIDKGYDTFIEVAHLLLQKTNRVKFHVVGNFSENDICVDRIKANIIFHNALKSGQLTKFYASMDIIVSPNRSFALHPGKFDGFPLGTCVEAGMNGVALFISDDLKQNRHFEDKKDFVLITNDASEIASKILYYLNNRRELDRLAEAGKEILLKLYDTDFQIEERLKLLKSHLQ